MATDTTLVKQIADLKKLKIGGLRERYKEVFGEETKSGNKEYLFKRIAHRLQEKVHGGITPRAKERAAELAQDAPIRRRPNLNNGEAGAAQAPGKAKRARERDPRIPAAGTVLKANHKGKEYTAKVLDQGFEYRGKTYRSLSAIAKDVTGCSWNGLVFFGLGKLEKPAAAAPTQEAAEAPVPKQEEPAPPAPEKAKAATPKRGKRAAARQQEQA